MNKQNYYIPAEWESQGPVMVSWPHGDTDWADILDWVTACYKDMVIALVDNGVDVIVVGPQGSVPQTIIDRCSYIPLDTNDTWIRDYGPITSCDTEGKLRLNDFKFNGWGLKFASDKDNLVTHTLLSDNPLYVNRLSFVLEGGSIDSDGKGTMLTTSECLLSLNRNGSYSKDYIEDYLLKALNAERLLWLDHGYLAGDDTDSHVDTLARFAPNDTILYTSCDDKDDEHFAELSAMEAELQAFKTIDGKPYKLIALPIPRAIYDDEGNRLPATYANFLCLRGVVFVPTYDQPDCDNRALERIGQAFTGFKIVGVPCSALIQQHGSLHCATMQLYESPKFDKQ